MGTTVAWVQSKLDELLRGAGCTCYTADDVRVDFKECWGEVREDRRSRGGDERPFFEFIVEETVGVFVFFESALSIYVVPGSEWLFREHFDRVATIDVVKARALLAKSFGKADPDVTIPAPLSITWLEGG